MDNSDDPIPIKSGSSKLPVDDDETRLVNPDSDDVTQVRTSVPETLDNDSTRLVNSTDDATRIGSASPKTQLDEDATRLAPSKSDDETRLAPGSMPQQDDATRIASAGATLQDTAALEPSLTVPAGAPPTLISMEATMREEGCHTFHSGMLIKGRFKLVKELGRGGMGMVFSARDLVQEGVGEKDSLIAIKLLSDEIRDHPDALRMLQQETKKTRELAHPNIITVYDFDRDDETVYMTMELMSGQSLEDYLKERRGQPPSLEEVLPLIRGMAEGLKYAHQNHIIHSDLKPANVFVTDNGVKILDFGIARAVKQSESNPPKSLDANDTSSQIQSDEDEEEDGVFALTPTYASLEQFQGKSPDPADDIYSFACICYQLLVNKHPFGKRSAKDAFSNGLLPNRIEGLKDAQWNAILSGLALERGDRAATVEEFVEGFLPKRREPWKMVAVMMVLLASLISVYFFTRPPEIVAPSLFENPPPAAVLEPAQKLEIEQMLEVAEVHMMVDRLLSPPGSNALDEYQKILELNPYNREAIAGLASLIDRLLEIARSSIGAGDLERAREVVAEGLKIHPEHNELKLLNNDLGAPQH